MIPTTSRMEVHFPPYCPQGTSPPLGVSLNYPSRTTFGVLDPRTNLSDGSDTTIPLNSQTFLAWIALHPELFFIHPTADPRILLDKSINVVEGGWWPELNGKPVLYNSQGKFGIISPFELRGGEGR